MFRRQLSTAVSGLAVAAAMMTGQASASPPPSAITITGQTAGPRPFIELVSATTGSEQIASVNFTVLPMSGSYTRPISATYSAAYLTANNYLSSNSVTVPVFGLYAGYANTVILTFTFTDGTTAATTASITTATYTDPCNSLNNRISFVNNRKSTSALSFDYFLLKNYCSSDTPVVLDTDGNVRWASDTGHTVFSSTFFQNNIYESDAATGINRVTLAGVITKIGDYGSADNLTSTNHHNIDPGRTGMVVDVNTTTQTESNDIEIAADGTLLNTWNLADIISQAMKAGGDDPSGFVFPVGNDWFHNNATTYDPVHNWLIVSSRENFVIAVDYDPPADGSVRKIHWILGDTTKHWAQYPSLRAFALTLSAHTQPPIGQHGVAIDAEGELRLFDDGYYSLFQKPPGVNRKYSAGRAYVIDPVAMTATENVDFGGMGKKQSQICGSFYEDASKNNLFDYSAELNGTQAEIQGLGPKASVVFDLIVPDKNKCGGGWNALPIHWENLQF